MTGDGIAEMMDNIMSQVYEYKIVPEKEQAEKNPQAAAGNQTGVIDLNAPRKSMDTRRGPGEETPQAGGCC